MLTSGKKEKKKNKASMKVHLLPEKRLGARGEKKLAVGTAAAGKAALSVPQGSLRGERNRL